MKKAKRSAARKEDKDPVPPNPFTDGLPPRRNAEEVWKELYAKSKPTASKPISREEVLRRTRKKDR